MGALFILVTYCKYKELRTNLFLHLVASLSACDLMQVSRVRHGSLSSPGEIRPVGGRPCLWCLRCASVPAFKNTKLARRTPMIALQSIGYTMSRMYNVNAVDASDPPAICYIQVCASVCCESKCERTRLVDRTLSTPVLLPALLA